MLYFLLKDTHHPLPLNSNYSPRAGLLRPQCTCLSISHLCLHSYSLLCMDSPPFSHSFLTFYLYFKDYFILSGNFFLSSTVYLFIILLVYSSNSYKSSLVNEFESVFINRLRLEFMLRYSVNIY